MFILLAIWLCSEEGAKLVFVTPLEEQLWRLYFEIGKVF